MDQLGRVRPPPQARGARACCGHASNGRHSCDALLRVPHLDDELHFHWEIEWQCGDSDG